MCQTLDAGGSKQQAPHTCLKGHGLNTSTAWGAVRGASRAALNPAWGQGWVSTKVSPGASVRCKSERVQSVQSGWARISAEGLGDRWPLAGSLQVTSPEPETSFPPLYNGNDDRLTWQGCEGYLRRTQQSPLTQCLAHKETSVRCTMISITHGQGEKCKEGGGRRQQR